MQRPNKPSFPNPNPRPRIPLPTDFPDLPNKPNKFIPIIDSKVRMAPCPRCNGRGYEDVPVMMDCPYCAMDLRMRPNCPKCHGSGKMHHQQKIPCRHCRGDRMIKY